MKIKMLLISLLIFITGCSIKTHIKSCNPVVSKGYVKVHIFTLEGSKYICTDLDIYTIEKIKKINEERLNNVGIRTVIYLNYHYPDYYKSSNCIFVYEDIETLIDRINGNNYN